MTRQAERINASQNADAELRAILMEHTGSASSERSTQPPARIPRRGPPGVSAQLLQLIEMANALGYDIVPVR